MKKKKKVCHRGGPPTRRYPYTYQAVPRYKVVKTPWRDGGIALVTWNEYGGRPNKAVIWLGHTTTGSSTLLEERRLSEKNEQNKVCYLYQER